MKRLTFLIAGALFLLAGTLAVQAQGPATEPARISKEELKGKLGDAGVIVVDVRAKRDWNTSDRKIAGAFREDPDQVSAWAAKYSKDKTLALYCA